MSPTTSPKRLPHSPAVRVGVTETREVDTAGRNPSDRTLPGANRPSPGSPPALGWKLVTLYVHFRAPRSTRTFRGCESSDLGLHEQGLSARADRCGWAGGGTSSPWEETWVREWNSTSGPPTSRVPVRPPSRPGPTREASSTTLTHTPCTSTPQVWTPLLISPPPGYAAPLPVSSTGDRGWTESGVVSRLTGSFLSRSEPTRRETPVLSGTFPQTTV